MRHGGGRGGESGLCAWGGDATEAEPRFGRGPSRGWRAQVLEETGFAEERTAKLDQDDFLRLLAAFNAVRDRPRSPLAASLECPR